MEMVFSLMGITFVLVVIIALVFVAAIRSGQFEDLEGPAWRVVLDQDRPPPVESSTSDPDRDTGARADRQRNDSAS